MRSMKIRSPGKIRPNLKQLEKKLKVKIELKSGILIFSGEELDEYIAEKVFEAIDLGFSTRVALLLIEEDYLLELISIKSNIKKNPALTRARIIGTKRKTLDTLESLSNCFIALHENTLGVIGHVEDVKGVIQALSSVIRGAKVANVYAYLEKLNRERKPFILDLKKPGKGKTEAEEIERLEENENLNEITDE